MKVALLSTNDIRGGAAVVTLRLTEALRRAGVEATMVCARIDDPGNPLVANAENRRLYQAAFLAERLHIFAHNGLDRRDLFKTDTARFGLPLDRHPVVRAADVVVLTWVNQGLISLGTIQKIAREKPVVWIMHDLWPVTGVCHHAGTCTGYTGTCRDCPMLWPRGCNSLAARVLAAKRETARECGIHFVAVSSWLGDKASRSTIAAQSARSVIPNPFPVERYAAAPAFSRTDLGLPTDGKIVMMAAARLDDDIKGFPLAIEALNRLDTGATGKVTALFAGDLRDPHLLDSLRLPYVHTGPVTDPARMHSLYCAADVVISSSHYETLPTTLIEGQAAGAVPVAFDSGGQRDIIEHGVTGWLAPAGDTAALADGIARALGGTISTDTLRASVTARFSAPAVAQQYIALFHKLLRRGNATNPKKS